MRKLRTLLCLGLLLAISTAWAEKTEGLIITADGQEHQFAITDVMEVTFSDQGLTLVKTDDATVEIPTQWQIRFGEVETDGIPLVEISDGNAIAKVYNVEGKLIKTLPLSKLNISDLDKGVYIVSCAGKSFKILR